LAEFSVEFEKYTGFDRETIEGAHFSQFLDKEHSRCSYGVYRQFLVGLLL